MQNKPTAESGFGFLTRLASKPNFLSLETTLFPNGLLAKETVELSGDISSGKTLLLTQLIAKCLLPVVFDGLGIGVLFINTDYHFMISKLLTLISTILQNNWSKSENEAERISRESLKNLSFINCYDNSQFLISLHSLDLILLKNKTISLVVIDSISSYYWFDKIRRGFYPMDQHIKSNLKIIQKHTVRARVSLIYTKSFEMISNSRDLISCSSQPTIESINYRISLHYNNEKFFCNVETSSEQKTIEYTIDDNGIRWI